MPQKQVEGYITMTRGQEKASAERAISAKT